jgi:hypothetical protein
MWHSVGSSSGDDSDGALKAAPKDDKFFARQQRKYDEEWRELREACAATQDRILKRRTAWNDYVTTLKASALDPEKLASDLSALRQRQQGLRDELANLTKTNIRLCRIHQREEDALIDYINRMRLRLQELRGIPGEPVPALHEESAVDPCAHPDPRESVRTVVSYSANDMD